MSLSETKELKEDLIDSKQLKQFELFLNGYITLFGSDCDHKEVLSIFLQSIRITNEHFEIETLGAIPSSYLELRIILGLGIVHAEMDNIDVSNKLLEFVYNEISRSTVTSSDTKKIAYKNYLQSFLQ